jgi:hypothetical protein
MAVEEPGSRPPRLHELGVVEVLEKPISPARLKALLRQLPGLTRGLVVPASAHAVHSAPDLEAPGAVPAG